MTNEELQEEIKRLEKQLTELRFKISKSKVEDKPYEVEVPEDINHLGYLDEDGYCIPLEDYDYKNKKNIYIRGLAFETREQAERYDRERMLLFKMHKWAEKHNGDWTPNWEESEDKFYIDYHHGSRCFQVKNAWHANAFHKLPYFKSEEIALQFIDEFVEEIHEVFY